jgi:transcriptional regulator GlxA family with amidase domain
VHRALATEPPGLGVDESVLGVIDALRPHLRPVPAERARGRAEHAAVRRARRHLGERWDQRIPLADLAAVACLSRFELVRRFGAETGLTPHAYQINMRIARARALLADGVMPAAVAAECGFADQPHLTRAFKRAVGVTPARYARAVAG